MITGRPVIASNKPSKSLRWNGNSSFKASVRASLDLLRIMRCTMGRREVLEEHVLGAAQADPTRPEGPRALRVARIVGIGPDLQPRHRATVFAGPAAGRRADFVSPGEQLHQVLLFLELGRTVGILPTNASPVPPSTLTHSPSLT